METRYGSLGPAIGRAEPRTSAVKQDVLDLEHRPEAVLSVLEADQLFAAKQHAQLGRAQLSRGARVLMWGLRIYVVVMFIIVAMQVVHVFRG